MIKDAKFAKQMSDLMLDLSGRIRQSVVLAESSCAAQDCAAYQKAATQILSTIDAELLGPLYAEHPSLRPAGWSITPRQTEHSRSLGGIIQPV
jgi:hypothetical protein